MKSILIAITLTITLCTLNLVYGQSNNINPQNILPGELDYEYIQQQGEVMQPFGTLTEKIIDYRDDNIFEVVITQNVPNATMIDSLVMESKTFTPTKFRSYSKDIQDILVTYNVPGSTKIHLQRVQNTRKQDTVMISKTEAPVFDYHWAHIPIAAIADEVEKGESVTIPIFTYKDKVGQQTVYFEGNTTLELNNKTYQSKIWKTTDKQTGIETMYWIDKKTGRMLQTKATMPNKAIFWIKRKKNDS